MCVMVGQWSGDSSCRYRADGFSTSPTVSAASRFGTLAGDHLRQSYHLRLRTCHNVATRRQNGWESDPPRRCPFATLPREETSLDRKDSQNPDIRHEIRCSQPETGIPLRLDFPSPLELLLYAK
jgi:hypothetical protein